ncbi:hypothetical protein ONZ45_g13451 [Pleurotus djamor]|nr:hypothetical protein ONZ45_g13451 [Pleurotus djamor]
MHSPVNPVDLSALFAQLGLNPGVPSVSTTIGSLNCTNCGVPSIVVVHTPSSGTNGGASSDGGSSSTPANASAPTFVAPAAIAAQVAAAIAAQVAAAPAVQVAAAPVAPSNAPPADNANFTAVTTYDLNTPDAPGHWYSVAIGREVGVLQDWEGVVRPLVIGVPYWCCRRFATQASALAFLEDAIVGGQAFTYHGP